MPHQTMDDQARARYESQSLQLRVELKRWENDWASAHGGRKPGRDDIKHNADIAQKYKQYNKLRDILAGKIPPPLPPQQRDSSDGQHDGHRKRTQSDAALLLPQTPSKRAKPTQTPRKAAQPVHPDATHPGTRTPAATAATPSLDRRLFTPAKPPTSISPTPQKDGRVLGLFDLLAGTPSKARSASLLPPQKTATNPVLAAAAATTPSHRRTVDVSALLATSTPTTSASRFARHADQNPRSKRPSSPSTTANPDPQNGDGDEGGGKGNGNGSGEAAEPRFFYTTAATPRHARPGDDARFAAAATAAATATTMTTPTSARTSKLKFSTPAFLRRRTVSTTTGASTTARGGGARARSLSRSLSRVDEQQAATAADGGDGGAAVGEEEEEEEEEWKVGPLRLPRRLVPANKRSLSAVVAGLRRIEEEERADEMEIVRYMEAQDEAGMEGLSLGGKPTQGLTGASSAVGATATVDGDSQPPAAAGPGKEGAEKASQLAERDVAVPLLSGFDDEALYDSPNDDGDRRQNGQPLRVFKKRGQKRTTRLVNMRPTRAKRPAQTDTANDDDDDDDDDGGDVIPETQLNVAATATKTTVARDDVDELRLSDPDGDFDAGAGSGSDNESDEDHGGVSKKTKQKKQGTAAGDDKIGAGAVKRAVRKVKATAHANFKRLKLRNSGAKGGPGHNSRWRRRR